MNILPLIKESGKVVMSVVISVFSLVMTRLSLRMTLMDRGEIGPGLLPFVLASMLSIFAIVNMVTEIQKCREEKGSNQSDVAEEGESNSAMSWVLILIFAAYILIMQWLGLFLSTLLFCPPIILIHQKMPILKVFLISFCIAASTSIIFTFIFNLGLPEGILGF